MAQFAESQLAPKACLYIKGHSMSIIMFQTQLSFLQMSGLHYNSNLPANGLGASMAGLHSILISVGTEICPPVSRTQTPTEFPSTTVIALGSISNEATCIYERRR